MKHFLNEFQNKKSPALLLIFLCWLVYATSYLGKVNYSANITQIIDFYGVTKAQAGAVPTFFFFAYGVGQFVNGSLCKKYHIKSFVFASLIISAAINLTIAITTNFSIIKWLWLTNGIVLSILWPSLIRLLSEALPKKSLGLSTIAMGTTVAIGTLTIYGLSSIYAAFDKFKLSFYTAGVAVLLVAVVWMLLYNKAVAMAKSEKENEEEVEEIKTDSTPKEAHNGAEKKILLTTICVLCFCAIGVNLIKDGLTTWVPSILKEEFSMSDSLSILLTLFLPVLAIFGNVFALRVHKKFPDYITHCAVIFAVIIVFIGIIIGSLVLKLMAFMLMGLILVNFLASSLNNLLTSIFPLFMREKISSGSIAGMINGFCYVGSTISSYGLGVIADNFGWMYVFWTLIGVSAAAIIAWCIYTLIKRVLERKADA